LSSTEQKYQHAVKLHAQGKTGQARKLFNAVLRAHPDHSGSLNQLGFIAYREGDIDGAASLISKAVEADPGNLAAIQNLGNLRIEQNRFEEAEACYRKALSRLPGNAELLGNLCVLLRKRGQLDEAVRAGRKSASLAPENPVTWYSLGLALTAQGKDRKAVSCLEKAVGLKPDFTVAHNMLCQATYRLESGRKLRPRGFPKTCAAYQRWYEHDHQNPIAEFMLRALKGDNVPERSPDGVTRRIFDDFAEEFEKQLTKLEYRAPDLVGAAVRRRLGEHVSGLDIVDGGCGTGLMGRILRPMAGGRVDHLAVR
jgi:predicted TPR repeat methyltransferase